MKKLIGFAIALSGALCLLTGQDAIIKVSKEGGIPAIAIPDLRGAGDAQKFMAAFNQTLSADVRVSGRFKIVPKTSLPTFVPQQPSDFQQPAPPAAAPRSADASRRRSRDAHQRRRPLDAGLVQPARPGQLPGLRLHRRAERSPGAAGLALSI